jgi:hypothetical protein
LSRDFRSESTVSQPEIEHDKVRLGVPCERERVGDGAGNAANLVTVPDKDLFRGIREHEIVFNYQDLEHAQSSGSRLDSKFEWRTCEESRTVPC